jgi:hypothetical protein
MIMVTRKYYDIYMVYPFVGKLAPGTSGWVWQKLGSFVSGAKFNQWAGCLWPGYPNGSSPRV